MKEGYNTCLMALDLSRTMTCLIIDITGQT
jgi:hypothetical protein